MRLPNIMLEIFKNTDLKTAYRESFENYTL